jgi:hypothetical protein
MLALAQAAFRSTLVELVLLGATSEPVSRRVFLR